MKVERRYHCLDCGHRYRRVMMWKTPDPPCPKCGSEVDPPPDRIAAPAITGTRSRAVDEAWKIAQQDFGMTNMRDGMREGDTAYIPPPAPPPIANTGIPSRPVMIWGGAQPAASHIQLGGQAGAISIARRAAALAKAEGRSPLELFHKSKPQLKAIPVNK